MNYQALPLAQESDACCPYDQQLTKRDFENKKEFKVKKISNIPTINKNSSGDGQASQSNQPSGHSSK